MTVASPYRFNKKDPVMLGQVRRYIRRHGGNEEDAFGTIALARISGPKEAERNLAAAMEAEGMTKTCVKMARDGYWSDFKSPLEYPKSDLVKMLRNRGRNGLATRVEEGEFDG